MFEEGNLLLFTPFYFKNGAMPQPKFFLVLKAFDGNMLLASLPTSKDHVPSDISVKPGCFEDSKRQVNVFVFLAGESVACHPLTNREFAFSLNTFIYGADLETYPVSVFEKQIADHLSEVNLIGKILEPVYRDLRECLKHSRMVKNKYKRLF